MDISEFLIELRQLVAKRSTASHLVDTLAFVNEIADRLEEDPVFGEFTQIEYQGIGSRNRTLRVHGFTALDDSDGSIGLVIGKWEDISSPETLTTQVANQLSGYLENFVRESIENNLYERIAEANPAYELSLQLFNEKKKINRIRLHILTNLTLSSKFKEELHGEVAGIPLEKHIWDLERLSAIYQSNMEREAVEINFSEYASEGVQCIEAANSANLKSYLCVIKGDLLANLFDRFGSRLLEGNVRSFLGMKGGVNKGIRSTIQDSPDLFFAYNNGIAATASAIEINNSVGIPVITKLTDLQIVNGGQTTASILSARKKDKLSLDGVSVQMKLTIVERTNAQNLIPKIAEYANTQNKVAVADFFANHPFHQKMQSISRRLLTPARAGQRIQSKWFYERSRGQYQNERLYLSTSQKNAFDKEYPSDQMINKTELGKLDNTWNEKPHWVSLGAQKNFTKFANQFESKSPDISESEYWDSISSKYGDSYFKNIVSVAILWDAMEKIVDSAKSTWYQGGYRANIVTYTISKIFHEARSIRKEIDLESIWLKQELPLDLKRYLEKVAIVIQSIILEPPPGVKNVGEWCKKELCWKNVSNLKVVAIDEINSTLIDIDDFKKKGRDGVTEGAIDDSISIQSKVLELTNSGYFKELYYWSDLTTHFSPLDKALVLKASTLQGFMKIPLEKDWKKLLEIRSIAEEEGFRKSA
jgi:hypothetical protein